MSKRLTAALLSAAFLLFSVNALAFTSPPEGWTTSIPAAVETARAENKDIVVWFSGSDWCSGCKILEHKVFTTKEWYAWSASRFIPVIIDLPEGAIISAELKQTNQKLVEDYSVTVFPTLFLLDRNGQGYAKFTFQEWDAQGYMNHMAKLQTERKATRDALLMIADDESRPGAERATALEKLFNAVADWGVGFTYPEVKAQIVELDDKNAAGLRVKYARLLALDAHKAGDASTVSTYAKMIGGYDEQAERNLEVELALSSIKENKFDHGDWAAGLMQLEKTLLPRKPDGVTAQELYLFASIAASHIGNFDLSVDYGKRALAAAPNSPAASTIQKTIERLEKRLRK